MRYPGNESCAQEHQDSLLRDCVGKNQHVSLLLWLAAMFQSTSQLCLGSWICLRTLPMTKQPTCESERWSSCQKLSLARSYFEGDTNVEPAPWLWPRWSSWPKRHLYLSISFRDLIWATVCRARIWCFGKASVFNCNLSSMPSLQSGKIILLSAVLLLASCNSHRQQLC